MLVAFSVLVSVAVLFLSTRRGMWSWLYPQPDRLTTRPAPASSADTGRKRTQDATKLSTPVAEDKGLAGDDAEESTPKASPASNGSLPPVPTLHLVEVTIDEGEEDDDHERDEAPPPLFPALNSAQRASGLPSPRSLSTPKATANGSTKPTASQLMPPPRLPASSLRTTTSSSPSLRIPSTGPLPNRGAPSPQKASTTVLGVPAATAVKTPNPRQKVQLAAGHSPLDWANLQRSGANLSGVRAFQRVPPSVLKAMNGRKGRPAWSSYQGRVYNIGAYLPYHPGGEGELRRAAGRDGEKLFMEVHPWVNWENMLQGCVVGILVPEEVKNSPLEEMD